MGFGELGDSPEVVAAVAGCAHCCWLLTLLLAAHTVGRYMIDHWKVKKGDRIVQFVILALGTPAASRFNKTGLDGSWKSTEKV